MLLILGFLWVYSWSAFGAASKNHFEKLKSKHLAVEASKSTPLESDNSEPDVNSDLDDDTSSEEVGDEELSQDLFIPTWKRTLVRLFSHYEQFHIKDYTQRLLRPPDF